MGVRVGNSDVKMLGEILLMEVVMVRRVVGSLEVSR